MIHNSRVKFLSNKIQCWECLNNVADWSESLFLTPVVKKSKHLENSQELRVLKMK